jgi:tetratricopeptide (TPR) repeat protein
LSAAHDRQASAQRLYAEGVACQQQRRLPAAIAAWRDALAIDPLHSDARYNLAVGLGESGEWAGSEKAYSDLLSIRPDHCKALYNFANLKMRRGETDAAEQLYRRLVAVDSRFAGGWINLAMARSVRGDLRESESCLRAALALEPANVGAHCNLAHLLLTAGRWPEAWREYEWRLRRPECPAPPVRARDWTSDDAGAGRILLWNDQGLGDAIQFLRYVPLLAERGNGVWLFVQDALKVLAQSIAGVAGVAGVSDPAPPVDAQAPLLSLPHRLGLPDPAASWRGAFLTPRHAMTLRRRPGCLAVGLVWSSNPGHPNRMLRDVPLEALKPLLDIDGIDWFGLQVGPAARDISAAGLAERIEDLSPLLGDFADTAAAVAALDLVITVDTSMPHLAGAMAKPGWVMISTAREWRWAGQETRSPWYPSLRLFRQDTAGNWSTVVSAIATELRARPVDLTPARDS